MERRNFIKIVAAGSCYAFYPSLFSGCTTSTASHDLKQLETDTKDIRLKLISYATLAPNSHNIQPWQVHLTGENRFELYVDQTRLLPKTDPPARQIHVSQGTFLEYLRIAASGLGYRVEIDYFPRGEYSNLTLEEKPVASIALIADTSIVPDPLFPFLQVRQSNKRVYEARSIPPGDMEQLRGIPQDKGLVTRFSDSPDLLQSLGHLLGKAMAIESASKDRNKETVDIFRFNEEEALAKRDGFTLANNGVTGFKRFVAETFFLGTKEEAYDVESSFSREGIKMAYKQAESATAYGWLISENNSRLNQVRSGHLYTRINLQTTKLGIAQHPMSQILEEYEDMKEAQQSFLDLLKIPSGHTVQMLFRLGYANPVPHTLRRVAKDIVA